MANQNNSNFVDVTINKPGRILHFSDGVEEEIEEQNINEVQSQPKAEEPVDPKTLDWGRWFAHYASTTGTKVLNAVDYAGESLSDFFGITTPKYQLEINEYERMQEEKRKMEEEAIGWVPKDAGGDIPLVLTEPSKVEGPTNV